MLGGDPAQDKSILKKVSQRLARGGMGSQSHINLTVTKGQVVMSGTLQYENQRRPALAAARGVEGVRGIIDQLQIKPLTNKWQ